MFRYLLRHLQGELFLRRLKTGVTFCNRLEIFTKLLTETRFFHRGTYDVKVLV